MAETSQLVFKHPELARILVEHEGITEGHWGVFLKFGLGAGNVPGPDGSTLIPAAIVPVIEVGIQKFSEPNSLTFDASTLKTAKKGAKRVTVKKV